MPFIEMALGDAKEKKLLDEGNYELTVSSINKGGDHSTVFVLEAEDPEYRSISHFLNHVRPDDDEDKANYKLVMTVRFLDKFNVPYEENGFRTEDFLGARGRFDVKVDEWKGQYRNRINLGY